MCAVAAKEGDELLEFGGWVDGGALRYNVGPHSKHVENNKALSFSSKGERLVNLTWRCVFGALGDVLELFCFATHFGDLKKNCQNSLGRTDSPHLWDKRFQVEVDSVCVDEATTGGVEHVHKPGRRDALLWSRATTLLPMVRSGGHTGIFIWLPPKTDDPWWSEVSFLPKLFPQVSSRGCTSLTITAE